MSAPSRSTTWNRKKFLLSVFGIIVVFTLGIMIFLRAGLQGSETSGTKTDAESSTSIVVPTGGQVPPAQTLKATTVPQQSVPAMPGTPVPTASAAAESADGQKQKAAVSVADFVKVSAATLETAATPNTEDLAAVASGSVLEGVIASAAEFEVNGWHQEGQPSVLSANVISYDHEKSPDTMTLGICVDSSKVNVVNETGTVVRAGAESDRSLNLLTMTRGPAGDWTVSKLSFPDNPNC